MNAPQTVKPSVLSDTDLQELAAVREFGGKDTHISSDESPWFNWVGEIEVKILRIDNRTGTFVIGLRSPSDQGLGKHRHRGIVTATAGQAPPSRHRHRDDDFGGLGLPRVRMGGASR